MENMVTALKNCGFEVRKEYDKRTRRYQFTVTKDSVYTVSNWFPYPEGVSEAEKDRLQCEFLSDLVKRHDECYRKYHAGAERQQFATIANTLYGGIAANNPAIKNVIFNDIATIVFWTDGTKTVVKWGPHDIYDPEKGLAMAISKKALGNQGNYYNVFKKWLPQEESSTSIEYHPVTEHYGYVPGITAVWPYIVCHRDEAHLAHDPKHYDGFFKTRSLQNVKAECANLEVTHYSNRPLSAAEALELSKDGHELWVESHGSHLTRGDNWYRNIHEWAFTGYGTFWVAYRDKPGKEDEEQPGGEPETLPRLEALMKAAEHVLAAKKLLDDGRDA
jgi:hypothetical protein